MPRTVEIARLMEASGVKFGTSGARGLAAAMTDETCYAYTKAFFQHLRSVGEAIRPMEVALAGDLRPSTDRILASVLRATADAGHRPVFCGKVPSPAVALYGIDRHVPSIMVTGSHIPDDRNGIKFNKCAGEILKNDEAGIRAQCVDLPDLFDNAGAFVSGARPPLPTVDSTARELYLARSRVLLPPDLLSGRRVGLYEHSAVGRDLLGQILSDFGADVVRLARSETFVPVDTEAIRPTDVELAIRWASEDQLFAIVSTDGDSDRPLIADETGKWFRGDVAGIFAAKYLAADIVVTPVSCNTAVEKSGWFNRVIRSRIGSPYVIEHMVEAVRLGGARVVGYEANGGFLTATDLLLGDRVLSALPTRDAVTVLLGVLGLAIERSMPVSALIRELPSRFTASDRVAEFPPTRSAQCMGDLQRGGFSSIEAQFGERFGSVASVDTTDGLRITFQTGEILHLRPSGNAPDLRCYTEAESDARAWEMARQAIDIMSRWK